MSTAVSPSWGSHSSSEPGQPFVPLQEGKFLARWFGVLITAIL